MSLVEHARRELELSGQTAEDPAYAAALVAAVAAFASYGHSGGSASVAIEQLHTLLQFRTLAPLTSDPDEWFDQSAISGAPLWQNRRDSAAFSKDGGQTWYFVDDRKPPCPASTRQIGDMVMSHPCVLGVHEGDEHEAPNGTRWRWHRSGVAMNTTSPETGETPA